MKAWLETELRRIPPRGGLAEAARYAPTRLTALCRFLDDGRIEIDNNTVERVIRPIALGRKNYLFAGSDGGAEWWAIVASLLATANSITLSRSPTSRTSLNVSLTTILQAASTNSFPGTGPSPRPPPDHVSGMAYDRSGARLLARRTLRVRRAHSVPA